MIGKNVFRALLLLSLWLGLSSWVQADKVTYVYTDPQGTPLAEADAQGHITARYDYTPYGNSVASLGSPPNGPGYTGHVNDPETGLVYMQARYYQPTGRFLSPDPVGLAAGNVYSFNRYAYANNNPIVHDDPTGMFPGDANDSSCNAAYNCQTYKFSSNSSQGGIFHVTANALAADIAWVQGWATGNKALQQAAIDGMQKEFNGHTASEAVVSLLMTTEGGEDSLEMQEVPDAGLGSGGTLSSMRRMEFEGADYHGAVGNSVKSRGPVNGQDALDASVQVKSTSTRRVGIDYEAGDFVVFDNTINNVYHGHVRTWSELRPEMRNALQRAGMVDRRGNILGGK